MSAAARCLLWAVLVWRNVLRSGLHAVLRRWDGRCGIARNLYEWRACRRRGCASTDLPPPPLPTPFLTPTLSPAGQTAGVRRSVLRRRHPFRTGGRHRVLGCDTERRTRDAGGNDQLRCGLPPLWDHGLDGLLLL